MGHRYYTADMSDSLSTQLNGSPLPGTRPPSYKLTAAPPGRTVHVLPGRAFLGSFSPLRARATARSRAVPVLRAATFPAPNISGVRRPQPVRLRDGCSGRWPPCCSDIAVLRVLFGGDDALDQKGRQADAFSTRPAKRPSVHPADVCSRGRICQPGSRLLVIVSDSNKGAPACQLGTRTRSCRARRAADLRSAVAYRDRALRSSSTHYPAGAGK